MMHALFVVEGGPKSGLGHIYHSAAIADLLGAETTFVTPSGEVACQKLVELGYEPVSADVNSISGVLQNRRPNLVVVDVPWVERDLLQSIHKSSVRGDLSLVVIGNSNINLPDDVDRFADVVIDLNIGSEPWDYARSFVDETTGTIYLVGIRHFILRDEFYGWEPTFDTNDYVDEVLIMFGGSDPLDLTSRALSVLLKSLDHYELNIVVGSGYCKKNDLMKVLRSNKSSGDAVTVESNVASVAERMRENDIVLTSPGLTLLEALLSGVPPVGFIQNELQRPWRHVDNVYEPERIYEVEMLMRDARRNYQEGEEVIATQFESGRREVLETLRSVARSHRPAESTGSGAETDDFTR